MTTGHLSQVDEQAVSLDANITIPEEANVFRPLNWWVLIKPMEAAEKVGSILLSTATVDKNSLLQNVGIVVSVGNVAFQTGACAKEIEPPKRGDCVMYAHHSAQRVKYGGEELVLVSDNHILATGLDPAKTQLFAV